MLRYRLLLEKQTIFKKQNKLSFNEPVFLELLSIKASIECQIYLNRVNEYCSLIKKFLDTKIIPHQFRAKFLEMIEQDNKEAELLFQDFEQLANFLIHDNLDEFSPLFSRVHKIYLQVFEFGSEDDGFGVPEHEFKNSVEKAYFQIKNAEIN